MELVCRLAESSTPRRTKAQLQRELDQIKSAPIALNTQTESLNPQAQTNQSSTFDDIDQPHFLITNTPSPSAQLTLEVVNDETGPNIDASIYLQEYIPQIRELDGHSISGNRIQDCFSR